MRKVFNRVLLAISIAANLIVSRWMGQQAFGWMLSQATAEAKHVDNLFSFLVSIGTFVFIGLTGMILYSVVFYRAPQGDWSHGHPARHDWRLKTAWTVLPLLLVLWLSVQSFRIYQELNIQGLTPIVHLHLLAEPANAQAKTTEQNPERKPAAEEVEVTASQWSWSFRYPDSKVTSIELHLPLNQSVRWFYSHPAVYVMALPAFGIFSEILPAFSRNPLFGYRTVAIASFGIAFISILVWVHHMFASGTPGWMRLAFMISSMLIAVFTGIKEFAWVATVWNGRLHLDTPMLFALSGVISFELISVSVPHRYFGTLSM